MKEPMSTDITIKQMQVDGSFKVISTGSRGRLIRDVESEGRSYRKGQKFMVEDYVSEADTEDDQEPFYWGTLTPGEGLNNATFLATDVELDATPEEVAAEPSEYTITGKVTIEVTKRIYAHSREDAVKQWKDQGHDVLVGWDEMGKPKFKKLDPLDIAEKGWDY